MIDPDALLTEGVHQLAAIEAVIAKCRTDSPNALCSLCDERQKDADCIRALLARLAQITEERDAALKKADAAWSAATDETVVGFHRDMAARFAEDRDVQKHRARQAEADLARFQEAGEQVIAEMRASAGSDPSFEANRILKKAWADRLESLFRRPPDTQEDPHG